MQLNNVPWNVHLPAWRPSNVRASFAAPHEGLQVTLAEWLRRVDGQRCMIGRAALAAVSSAVLNCDDSSICICTLRLSKSPPSLTVVRVRPPCSSHPLHRSYAVVQPTDLLQVQRHGLVPLRQPLQVQPRRRPARLRRTRQTVPPAIFDQAFRPSPTAAGATPSRRSSDPTPASSTTRRRTRTASGAACARRWTWTRATRPTPRSARCATVSARRWCASSTSASARTRTTSPRGRRSAVAWASRWSRRLSCARRCGHCPS